MFHRARIKLTIWYMLITMLISGIFSVAFYQSSQQEFHRIIKRVEFFQKRSESDDKDFFYRVSPTPRKFPSIEELETSKNHLKIALIGINAMILFLAGGVGYILAGRTLKPIKDMLEDQNRFITDASHELRTPLTSLRSEIEVHLRDKNITLPQAKKLLESNLEEVLHLQSLSDRLITLTSYQQATNTSFTTLLLADVIDSAIKKVSPLAKSKQIMIDNKSKKASITGDEQSLVELFTILLDNAIKYSPKKTTITLVTKRHTNTVEITIIDQGIGIAEEDIPYIFDRFYRASKSRSKTETGGYGLGLSIAKNIVETHKGTISVNSKLGKGTTFSVCFQKKNLS